MSCKIQATSCKLQAASRKPQAFQKYILNDIDVGMLQFESACSLQLAACSFFLLYSAIIFISVPDVKLSVSFIPFKMANSSLRLSGTL